MRQEWLRQLVRRRQARVHAAIERACEDALQSGESGVKFDGERAWVDPSVPYGEIHDVSRVRD